MYEVRRIQTSGHFALPLETQTALKEHDPFHTWQVTWPNLPRGAVAFQVVTTPLLPPTHKKWSEGNADVTAKNGQRGTVNAGSAKGFLAKNCLLPVLSAIWLVIKISWTIFWGLFSFVIEWFRPLPMRAQKLLRLLILPQRLNPADFKPIWQELSTIVKGKIDQTLFETSIRILVVADTGDEVNLRLNGLMAAFGQLSSSYQSLVTKTRLVCSWVTIWTAII